MGGCGLEPRACEPGAGAAGCCPCWSPTRDALTPRNRSRSRSRSQPRRRARPPCGLPLPGACSSFSGPRRCPNRTWGDASPRRPRAPCRGLGDKGDQRARGVTDSCGAPAGPRPPAPRPCGPRDQRFAQASGSRSSESLAPECTWKEPGGRKLPLPEFGGAQASASEDPGLLGSVATGLRSPVRPFRGKLEEWVVLHVAGELGEVTAQEERNSPGLWSGTRRTPKARSHLPSRVSWPLDDCTRKAGLLRWRRAGRNLLHWRWVGGAGKRRGF